MSDKAVKLGQEIAREALRQTSGGTKMKVILPELELTTYEHKYLVEMLKVEQQNLHEDLSGADCVEISQTAIRLLNDDSDIVESLLKKLG